jgi:hypothetical protein
MMRLSSTRMRPVELTSVAGAGAAGIAAVVALAGKTGLLLNGDGRTGKPPPSAVGVIISSSMLSIFFSWNYVVI